MENKQYSLTQIICTLLIFLLIPALVYALWRNYHNYAPRYFNYSWLMSIEPNIIYCYCVTGAQAAFAGFAFLLLSTNKKYFWGIFFSSIAYIVITAVAYQYILYLSAFNLLHHAPEYPITAAIEARRIATPFIELFYQSAFLLLNATGFICTLLFAILFALFHYEKAQKNPNHNKVR